MTKFTRIHNRFNYYVEDIDCIYCKHKKRKSKYHINACREKTCRYEYLKQKAIKNNRITRSPVKQKQSETLHESRSDK